ncbi:hypothetical protein [Nostoc sp.]|uniref:hypothetical protein n=1 Tax=Nostoc sp. TaxID=1180 RepID=UPI002FF8E91A
MRSSPYSPLGILRQALASPFGRRGDAKGDSVRAASRREAVASHLPRGDAKGERASGVSPSGAFGVGNPTKSAASPQIFGG